MPCNNEDGNSFRVDIKGKNIDISYDINYFNAVCHHEKEMIEIIVLNCIQKGKNFYFVKFVI